MSASTTPGPRPVVSVVVIVVSRRSILTAPPDTESYSLSSNCRYCDALAVLLMFFSIQSADHPSLVRPHWRNAAAAPVKQFTGGTQIRHFVMAITGSAAA